MLTSFFGKSSPINFLLLSIYIFVIVLIQEIGNPAFNPTVTDLLGLGGKIFLLLFMMLLLDFIIRKNSLTQSHTLGIFVFCCAVLLISPYLTWTVFLAQILILLGLRRIFSLTSSKNTEKKILDASLWIFAASFFSFWNLLWLIVLFFAISLRNHKELRHFFIPMIGLIGMFLIITAFYYLKDDSFQWFNEWLQPMSFDFTAYASPALWITITLLLSIFIWSIFHRVTILSEIPKKFKANFVLIFYASLIGILIALVTESKNGAELIFMLAPTAIVVANYLERNGDIYLKEIICWMMILMPIVIILL